MRERWERPALMETLLPPFTESEMSQSQTSVSVVFTPSAKQQAQICFIASHFPPFRKCLKVFSCSPGKQRTPPLAARQLASVLPVGSAPPANRLDRPEFLTQPEFPRIPLINAGAAPEKVTDFHFYLSGLSRLLAARIVPMLRKANA